MEHFTGKNKREIKFRVWDSISKAWHYWSNIQNNKFNDFDLEHYTLCQYTGLKDKNGVGIYEGDIVKCKIKNNEEYHTGEVKFNRSSWVIFQYNNGKIFMRRTSSYREYEVIGNIFVNPNLIK